MVAEVVVLMETRRGVAWAEPALKLGLPVVEILIVGRGSPAWVMQGMKASG
jgi:hypothetical protein